MSNRLRRPGQLVSLPPVVIDPPVRTGGGPQRIHITIEIRQTVARSRPSSGFGNAIAFLVLLLVLGLLFGCSAAKAGQQDGYRCTTYRVGFTDYTDCTPDWSDHGRRRATHCQSYRSGGSVQTVCSED
jgi:hypothetical protein